MTTAFIRDGYAEKGYIKEEPGLYEAVRFKYRPMLIADRDTLATMNDSSKVDDNTAHVNCARALEERIVEWDITEDGKPVSEGGKLVPITAANIMRIQPVLHGQILSLVRGYRGSDPDPDEVASTETKPEESIKKVDAAVKGQRPEDLLEAAEIADAKNSTAG